ncbi:hypothetical protein BGX38DRAFT_1197253 [Terfezia claveryi]|nr:hypothetical protein BGX38DRAFT_1197253 [Terfezia claveryi]
MHEVFVMSQIIHVHYAVGGKRTSYVDMRTFLDYKRQWLGKFLRTLLKVSIP